MDNELKAQFGQTMSPEDVGQVLRMHPSHVRQLCRDGELPSVKIGRRWRIPTDRLVSLLEQDNG